MKKCSLCEQMKPLSEFYKGKSKDGHSCYCKVCDSNKGKDWHEANKYKIALKRNPKEPIDCDKCKHSSALLYIDRLPAGMIYCKAKDKVYDYGLIRCGEYEVPNES